MLCCCNCRWLPYEYKFGFICVNNIMHAQIIYTHSRQMQTVQTCM